MLRRFKVLGRNWMLIMLVMASSGCTMITAPSAQSAQRTLEPLYGEPSEMGQGTVQTFATLDSDGAPESIGITFSASLLEGLPTEPNLNSRCFDANGNGSNEMDECIGDYELTLPLPEEIAQQETIPFQWATIGWAPHGHMPPIWTVPHFDFHFYMVSEDEVKAIRTGTCGEKIDCEDFERATVPIPPAYMPENYADVGAAVASMGNHLVDITAPELADPPQAEFTHSFIYGAYDGHITFYEPMVAHDFLRSDFSEECKAISQPQAWEVSGYYPQSYCLRYQADEATYSLTLEDFAYREAS
jgi:hypothetical protein